MSQETCFLSAYDALRMDKTYGKNRRQLDVPYDITQEECERLKPIFDLVRQQAPEYNCVRVITAYQDYNSDDNSLPRDVYLDLSEHDIAVLKECGYSLYPLYDKSYNGVQYNLCWIAGEVSPQTVMKYYKYKASQKTPEQILVLDKCVKCKVKVADMICDPCDHKCMCDTCGEDEMRNRNHKCPTCNQYINNINIKFDEL